jgi:hypothetical protein
MPGIASSRRRRVPCGNSGGSRHGRRAVRRGRRRTRSSSRPHRHSPMRRFHLINRVKRDAGVLPAIQAQHRPVQAGSEIHRMFRRQRGDRPDQSAVPGHARLQPGRVVRRIQPGDPAAPAETGDAQFAGVHPLRLGPGDGGVQIAHHLGVGHLGNHLAHQLGNFAIAAGVTLAVEQFGGNGAIALPGEAPGHVGNVLVHAEDLADQQHHRQAGLALGRRPVGRHLEFADRDDHLAGHQTRRIGLDHCLRADGHHRRGKA